MKYIVYFILVCFLLAWSNISFAGMVIGSGSTGYNLEQDLPATKDNSWDYNVVDDASNTYFGGRFVASSSYTLTKIEFYVPSIQGTPNQTLKCYIYSKTGDTPSTDQPNALLATATNTIDASTVAGDSWIAFTFAGLSLTNASGYWVVIKGEWAGVSYIKIRVDYSDAQCVLKAPADMSAWSAGDTSSQMYLRLYSGG